MIPKSLESIFTETNDSLPLSLKNKSLLVMLYDVLKEVSNSEARKELDEIKKMIEMS
jgi:hypothetical protein